MNFDRYVGLPFEERGRGPEAYDCWGLFRCIYADKFGISLPSFSESYVSTEDGEALSDLMAGHMGPWRDVASGQERIGDGVLMTLAGLPRHVGIVAAPGFVLHIERGTGSLIERVASPKISRRIVGFFRHESLFDNDNISASKAGASRHRL